MSFARIVAELTNAAEPVIIDRSIVYGRGTFACVYQGILKSTNEYVAVKEVKFNNHPDFNRKKCLKEAAILEHLNVQGAKGVIPFFGAYESINKDSFYFITPRMVNGQLTEWLHDENILNRTLQIHTIVCLAESVNYLHRKEVIHRDIKTDNVLFDANFNPVIIDFGLSTRIGTHDVANVAAGSPAYFSPELLTAAVKESSFADAVTKKVDIYSLALVIYQIFARDADLLSQYNDILALEEFIVAEKGRPTLPNEQDCPQEIAKLITWGWAQNADDRPTSAQFATAARQCARSCNVS